MNVSDILIARYVAEGRGFQVKYDYDVNGNVIYIGFAYTGAATTEKEWQIVKINYNASNDPTDETCTDKGRIWDNRTGIF